MSEGVKNKKGKYYSFSGSTGLEKENETTAEKESKAEAESRTVETMLVENKNDFLMNEGAKKPPTLRDLVTYGKSPI